MKRVLLVLGGAIAGGLLGYFAFFWIASHGLYGLILPGGLLGLGAGLSKNRYVALAVVCGLAALGLGLFAEWRFAPFADDESLGFFLLHVHHLQPITLLMIAAGGVIGFYLPYSRIEPDYHDPAGGRTPRTPVEGTKEGSA
jgi:hypothetical protein